MMACVAVAPGQSGTPGEYRLYADLAGWWPVISPVGEYQQDAASLASAFESALLPVRTVLDLGSGGGHIAWHLKDRWALTLVDRSAQMLAVSAELNPECEHLVGDMRTVRLGRVFDAVLVHDAVDYVTTEDDLLLVAQTAFAHCRPGGVAVFAPDHTADTFRPGTGGGGGADQTGRQASFQERTSDPDPADEWIEVEYEFTLRGSDNCVQVVRESHRLGAFRYETWNRVLAAAGFDPEPGNVAAAHAGSGDAPGLAHLFIGHRR
jgi:SAM-dependent methyltransferase